MRFAARCYRGHDPMWSFSPVSGAGAAKVGGRFNRPGEPMLYLSLDLMTSVGECTQGLTQRLQPLTICEYDVDCEPVADLRTAAGRARYSIALDDLGCGWLSYLRRGAEAPSWLAVDVLKRAGFVGMLAPSFVPNVPPDASNLILWQWSAALPTRVTVFDPSNRLPRDQGSWAPTLER